MTRVLSLMTSQPQNALSTQTFHSLIDELKTELMKHPQVETPLNHYFSKDIYAREITLEKGTLVIGKIHKHRSLTIISEGDVSILSIEGVKRVKAPFTFVSPPGVQRVCFAHEKTVWTSVHGTSETNLDKIEDEFIAKSYDEIGSPDIIEIEKNEEDLWLGQ